MPLDLSALSSKEAVAAIFIGYYDRAPAPNGLNYWSGEIDNGATLADTARAFSVVTESQTLYPALGTNGSNDLEGNVAFVTAVFQNLFNRAPNNIDGDGSGNFWVQQLEGGADIGQLILDIMSGANGADLEVLTNKIEVGINYATAAEAAGELARNDAGDTILDGVTAADTSVAAAQESIDSTFSTPTTPTPGDANQISLNPDAAVIPGTDGADIFSAESGDLTSAVQLNGGTGTDVLTVFNETTGTVAISPRTESIEQVYVTNQANDLNSVADNNVGGYSNTDGSGTVEVDVEIDAGRMEDVTRLENYDSRADLVIEDVRDGNPDDGTFTAAMTVAMVSTDPGNVDYAVYFDDPINTSTDSGTLTVQILDLDSSAAGNGPLANNPYDEVSFSIDGTLVRLTVEDLDAANASYATYIAALQASANAQDVPVTITAGNPFTLIQANGSAEVGTEINITVEDAQITEGGFNANDGLPANNNTVTRQTPLNQTAEAKITLNVEFDDVGKGSTGGDAMFGAMSTGRQTGDDATSDSVGIERFEITVDRGSILQTINSTNNSLEEVRIANGENSGINNTTNAADNAAGHLIVRGNANPSVIARTEPGGALNGPSGVETDGAMPGAAPQHNAFGFSDVRTIEAGTMNGALDITAELTEEIVEKYLDIQDGGSNGELDDVDFIYTLGNGNDEFLLNMSSDALTAAGTGSREDFDLAISGGNGADVITTNIGGNAQAAGDPPGPVVSIAGALKVIDEQGNDHYELTSDNVLGWYENSVSNVAADFVVSGGDGADTIWTHGWGDFTINDGAGADVVYTDNSGATQISDSLETNIDRNLAENDQIDYVFGAAWSFNAEFVGGGAFDTTGVTNDAIQIGSLATSTTALNSGTVDITVDYFGAGGSANAGTAYSVTVTIPVSEMFKSGTGVFVRDQAINQAVKRAINDTDSVMSNMLEAADGPGNSLAVYSKSDGAHSATDLAISIGNVVLNNGTPSATIPGAGQTVFDDAYAGTANDNGGTGQLFEATVSNADSTAESDNRINVAGDGANDLFVLSTSDAGVTNTGPFSGTLASPLTDLNGASNEVLSFSAGFGTDTVLNFDAADTTGGVAGTDIDEDVLDFTTITGVGNNLLVAALSSVDADGTVDIIDAAAVEGVDTNTTIDAAEVVALLGGGDGTASDHIVIITDTAASASNISDINNAGQVWHIVDGAGTSDVTATQIGTINLIGTSWTALTDDNIA